MTDEGIPTVEFSKAKTALSEIMTQVVREHRPQLVSRHRGKESMFLVRPEDLATYLRDYTFDPRVTIDAGEVTVELTELGVLGFGDSLEAATEDLVRELRAYTHRFFERSSFYLQTDRAHHAPWLLRFALTPPEHQLELLYEDVRVAP